MAIIANIKPTEGLRAEIQDSSCQEDFYAKGAEYLGKLLGGGKQYSFNMEGINLENRTGSTPFFNMALEANLPEGRRVMTYEDMLKIYSENKKSFNGIYSDTTSLCLRTNSPTHTPNTQIVRNLVSLVGGRNYSPENPLLISGLEMKKDDNSQNPYGIGFVITPRTTFVNDKRLAKANHGKTINFNGVDLTVWTNSDGVSSVYADDGGLYSNLGLLALSDDYGRVAVCDAVGVALQNFGDEFEKLRETYFQDLSRLRQQIDSEIESVQSTDICRRSK
ncbi:MAG: hypothetical protein ABIF88_00230 [archaeon]